MRLLALTLLATAACSTTGHTLAYRKAMAAKQKAEHVLVKSAEPYARHADALDDLIAEVDEAFTQSQSHNDNHASKQWLVVKDELKRYAADWQHMDAVEGPYADERRKIIYNDLDAIIADEAGKHAD